MNNEPKPLVDLDHAPTSFTAFKPVGHVVVGFPDDETSQRAQQLLADNGIADLQRIAADDLRSHMAEMLDLASGSAEFGHEIVAMRRFLAMAAKGYGWLVVAAKDDAAAARVVELSAPIGARVAIKYDRLIITDLL